MSKKIIKRLNRSFFGDYFLELSDNFFDKIVLKTLNDLVIFMNQDNASS